MIRKLLFAVFALMLALPLSAEENERKLVYVIPIKKAIEPALLYVIRRGVDEATRENADAIIFAMDTPGGRVNSAEDIVKIITSTDIPTYTFVKNNAFSAGAYIALATKHIYMKPGSVIGDITPILMSPTGGVQDLPESVEEKMTSGVAALVRSAAEHGGYDPQLAEAMVRRNIEYKVGDKVISESGTVLTLTASEASQLVNDGSGERPLLAKGIVKDVDELLEKIDLADAEKRTLEITFAEQLARWISTMAPLLMIVGFGGLWLEFKMPGFGVFGITGILCLLLFYFGHHIAGLAGMEDILIFAFGVALLAVEIFVLPGFGVAGVAGFALILVSLVNAMVENMPGSWAPISLSFDTLIGPLFKVMVSFCCSFVLLLVAGKYLPDTKAFKSLTLEESIITPEESNELIGLEGKTHSDLRPSGSAYFGGRKIDVLSEGDFIPRDTPVRIVSVNGNRIVVENLG